MKAQHFYKAASVLLLLFAAAHTFGFSQTDPQWGVDSYLAKLKSTPFRIVGSERTFWDLFLATGYSVGIFYLLAAILAWQLGRLSDANLRAMRLLAWGFALAFAGEALISWLYLFVIPLAFSVVIALCLAAAAWLSGRDAAAAPPQ
jgi:hypothetical protein